MAGLASLASQVATAMRGSAEDTKSAAYLIELDPQTDAPKYAATLQYFPESLSDSKAISWQSKEVPGGSLPMYQWTGSGERTLSFTVQFSSDIDYLASGALNTQQRLRSAGQEQYNVDIRSAIAWLRSFMLPTYSNSPARTVPPPKVLLYIPNSGIGVAGGINNLTATQPDAIVCVMTQCEVTWDHFFPSGAPRMASVSLGFAQVPQYKGVVSFPSANEAMRSAFEGVTPPLLAPASGFQGYPLSYTTKFKKKF